MQVQLQTMTTFLHFYVSLCEFLYRFMLCVGVQQECVHGVERFQQQLP